MLILLVSTGLIVAGIVGTILPVIPGTVIALAGILIHKIALGPASVPWEIIALALGITILTLVLDVWCSWWGARRFGATWKGALGAILGGVAGFLFFSLPGILIGPVVGAVLFELLDDRSWNEATRAGFGTVVGALLAFVLKVALTFVMAAAFYISLPGSA